MWKKVVCLERRGDGCSMRSDLTIALCQKSLDVRGVRVRGGIDCAVAIECQVNDKRLRRPCCRGQIDAERYVLVRADYIK